MIVVVLAVVWIVALTPLVLRRLSERQFTAGVRSYQRSLVRLGASSNSALSPERSHPSVPGAALGYSAAAQRLAVERYGEPPAQEVPALPGDRDHSQGRVPGSVSPAMAARRRLVMSVLSGSTLLFLLLGVLAGARFLWAVAFLGLVCTGTYLGLLVYFHRLAVEKAQKVIALETRRHASEVLESRRHVVALAHAGHAAPSYGGYGQRYASATGPVLSGSGWSVMGAHSPRTSSR